MSKAVVSESTTAPVRQLKTGSLLCPIGSFGSQFADGLAEPSPFVVSRRSQRVYDTARSGRFLVQHSPETFLIILLPSRWN